MTELHCGDCREILPTLGRVDAVLADPPYGMGWDTNCQRFSGGNKGHRKGTQGRDWLRPIEGDDRLFDPSPWLRFQKVILWGSNHFGSRLPVGTTLIWLKRRDPAFGSFLSDAEVGWMRSGHGVYCHRDLSMNAIAKDRLHPNQKPIDLMRWCIRKLKLKPGSTILDPYMGSGTVGIAAALEGHNFIGIEIDPAYFAVAEARIRAARPATAV